MGNIEKFLIIIAKLSSCKIILVQTLSTVCKKVNWSYIIKVFWFSFLAIFISLNST